MSCGLHATAGERALEPLQAFAMGCVEGWGEIEPGQDELLGWGTPTRSISATQSVPHIARSSIRQRVMTRTGDQNLGFPQWSNPVTRPAHVLATGACAAGKGLTTTERDKPLEVGDVVWAQVALDGAFDAVVEMDSGGRIRNLNRAACELFGSDREAAVGEPLAELIIPERFRGAHWAGLLRLARGERSDLIGAWRRLSALRADGSELPVEIAVVRSPADPELFTGFVRDVSALERAFEADRRARRLLIKAEESGAVGSWAFDVTPKRSRPRSSCCASSC